MLTIEYPTIRAFDDPLHINTLYFPELPIRGDDMSVTQYMIRNYSGHTFISYTRDPEIGSRYSNDGGRTYNYWDTVTSQWYNTFGYDAVVIEINYT